MNPRDFLRTAQRLAGSTAPADRRTAISRAYYAVYNVAYDLLLSLGFNVGHEHTAHEAVWRRLRESRATGVVSAGSRLRRLHQLRVRADYWMRDPHPERPATATLAVTVAESMIRDLDTAAADPATRERMIRAIQAWEQRAAGSAR